MASPSINSLYILTVFSIVAISPSLALMCWNCTNDGPGAWSGCTGELPLTPGAGQAAYFIDCANDARIGKTFNETGLWPPGFLAADLICRTHVQTIASKTAYEAPQTAAYGGLHRVHRGCGFDKRRGPCYNTKSAAVFERTCYCEADGCNHESGGLSLRTPITLVLIATFLTVAVYLN